MLGLPSKRRLKGLNARGDTIIEVLVVLAVLGLAIGISYATANRSLLGARQAQESTQATEIIQAQAEYLRSMAANPSSSSNYIYRAGAFCIDDTGNISTVNCNLGEAHRYKVKVRWNGAPTDKFVITATWDDVAGQGSDTNTLVYRVHALSFAPTGGDGLVSISRVDGVSSVNEGWGTYA